MSTFVFQSDIDEVVAALGDEAQGFSGKTVLLSGGRGFLGRYFTAVFRTLNSSVLAEPCKLIVVDNLITADTDEEVPPDSDTFRFVKHNIIEPLEIEERPDFVVHAAGIASPYYYRAHPLETLEVGIHGTRNMLSLAEAQGARCLFFSSSEIYGDPDPSLVPTEEGYRGNVSCQGPRACYDESKRIGETICYIYHEMHGVKTNIVRPFNVYGPGMKENDFRVLSNFGNRIQAKKPLKVYGTGNQTRTYCYVVDALNGFLRIMLRGVPGETYNIGNPEPEISVLDLAQRVQEVVARDLEFHIVGYPDDYPGDEPKRRCPDIRKARIQLGYEPRITLEEGLRRFFRWTSEHYTGKQW